jgi:hypothetical protein
MKTNGLGMAVGVLIVAIVAATLTNEATAQRYRHHHHDAAGHMVDHAGHHIDAYGRHTGAVGVYHNQYGYYSQGYGYGGYANPGYANQNYVNQGYANNYVPQNTLPYAIANPAVPVGGPIKIYNPADSGGDVQYSLNGTTYTIKPGSTQTLQYDRVWTVEFGSGGAAGNVRYSLEPGTYKFKVTDGGWNLFKSRDQATVSSIPPAPIPNLDPVAGPRPGIVP